MADIPRQLAALLGRQTVQIRKTDETPPRISVIDVISAISGHNSSNAALAFARLGHDYPDVTANCSHVKFPDTKGRKGQRDTPVANVRVITEVIMLLPGHHAARVRRQAAELLCRLLGGGFADNRRGLCRPGAPGAARCSMPG